jgi:hypothetical protein
MHNLVKHDYRRNVGGVLKANAERQKIRIGAASSLCCIHSLLSVFVQVYRT